MSNPVLSVELAREALKHGGVVYCNDTKENNRAVMLKEETTIWTPEEGDEPAFNFTLYQKPFKLTVRARDIGRFTYRENVHYSGPS